MERTSRFLHRFIHQGREFFFHSLTLEILEDPERCPAPDEEEELLGDLREEVSRDRGMVMGTLFLTTRCPRNCRYCFLQGVAPGDMTMEEVDRTLDILDPGADLLLYGGEPFLRPDLIRRAAEKARGRNLSIATGGIPLDRQTAAALADADTFVIVSMDGLPQVQEHVRRYPGGESFREAERAFHTLREAGCRVGISVTLTSWNIHRMPGDFISLMEMFEPDDMGLNPWMHPLKGGADCPGQVSVEEAFSSVTSCLEHAIRNGMYVEQLARRVRPFCSRTPRLKDCASAGGRLVVVPGGTAGGCDCMTVCGDHGVSLSDRKGLREIMNRLRDLSPVNFPGCLDCPALLLCGGGCRYDALHSSGMLSGVREERCVYERMFLNWMLERSVSKGRESLIPSGGFRREAMPMPVGTMLGENSDLQKG